MRVLIPLIACVMLASLLLQSVVRAPVEGRSCLSIEQQEICVSPALAGSTTKIPAECGVKALAGQEPDPACFSSRAVTAQPCAEVDALPANAPLRLPWKPPRSGAPPES